MKDNTRMKALNAFGKDIEYSAAADFKTNDLLKEIAGKRYDIYFQDDDPIWTIIGSLTASERRRFIKGVEEIVR